MSKLEIETLLADAFQGGARRSRELRLSQCQAEAIGNYPTASVVPLDGGAAGEKLWYQVSLSAPDMECPNVRRMDR